MSSPRRLLWIALVTLCAIGAAAATRRLVALSSAPLSGLDANFAAKAGVTTLHIVPSLLFVLLAPLQFSSALRRRWPRFHRYSGRVIIGLSVVVGCTALLLSNHPVGGVVEGVATTFFSGFFLVSAGKAWWHIRNRRVELHREWATRAVAIALGAAGTRPIMGVFFATSSLSGLTPQQFFGPAMWLGFSSTYLAAEVWIRYSRQPVMNPQERERYSGMVPSSSG